MTDPAWHLVFMGVSGSGKSTAAQAVNERLGWEYAEGDDFHPPANVEKMSAGHPLGDEDRIPWLQRMNEREHFMPPTLLESQLDTLEPLAADEPGMVVDPAMRPELIAQRVVAELGLG